jgi:hypothetical protein
MGIDRGAAARIEAFLNGHRDVAGLERRGAGREGEYDLCVALKPGAGAQPLATQLKALVPGKPRGPVTIMVGPRRKA